MKNVMTIMLFLSILSATAQERLTTADGMYDYVINSDHLTATIIEYNGSGTEANIPQTIDGLLVTTIGEAAFFNKGLTGQLIIPSGVRRIELDAFNSNHGLTSIVIPASVNYIHPDAFTYCNGVVDVYLYHIYPDITEPPLFHELDWADPNALSFAGPQFTMLHVMEGTIDAHQQGAVPSNNVAIRKWLETSPSSVVDDIPLPTELQFHIDETGFGTVYSTTGWVVPSGIEAQAIVWSDITTTSRDGNVNEEIDNPSQLMHYGWDASNPWVIDIYQPQHKYLAGETVPKGCGVLVVGEAGTYTAQLNYNAPMVPFRNLLHGRDFPSVANFPSTATDDVVSDYRLGRLRGGDDIGFLWERFFVHGTEQDRWKQDSGRPFVAEPNQPWLALTSDNDEGNLAASTDAHFFITFESRIPTSIETVESDNSVYNVWTDLMGRTFRQCPNAPGIYIHNQKKLIIK